MEHGTVVTAGPQYNYSYDAMNRLAGMTGPNNQTLVSSVSYGAANQMLQMNAASFTETRTYNANLQLTELVSGTSLHLKYNYSATQNNGRIQSQTDVISGETVAYTYDSLNRLIQASGTGDPTGSWSQALAYDGFGNLTQKTGSNAPSNLYLSTNPLTNQLTGNGASYDSNGNLSGHGTGSFAVSYSYDNENRLSVANPGGTSQTVFGYDQSNQRIYQGTYNTTHRPDQHFTPLNRCLALTLCAPCKLFSKTKARPTCGPMSTGKSLHQAQSGKLTQVVHNKWRYRNPTMMSSELVMPTGVPKPAIPSRSALEEKPMTR